jgi:hypothetical protein
MEKRAEGIVECEIVECFIHDAITGESRVVDYEEWKRLAGSRRKPASTDPAPVPEQPSQAPHTSASPDNGKG